MNTLILRMAKAKWLHVACAIVALISGIDDAMEAWFGVADLFRVDVHHGMIAMALSGVLKPLADLFDDLEDDLDKMLEKQ